MIALVVFFLSAYGIGAFVLSKLRLPALGAIEGAVASVATGLGVWCYGLFLLGHLGLFYKWILLGPAAATAIPGLYYLAKAFRRHPWQRLSRQPSLTVIVLLTAMAAIATLTFISCFSPVMGGIKNDEIATHLSVPHDWLLHHGICVLPYAVSHLAGHVELLFAWILACAPEYATKVFSWGCFILCALMAYAFAVKKMSRVFAVYAAAFVVINPLIFREAFLAFIDLPAALFNFLTLWALCYYCESKNNRFLFLAAFFMGVGCGAKPSNYFYLPALMVFFGMLLYHNRQREWTLLKKLVLLMALILLLGSPWPTRNMALTGSPTFPPPLALYSLNHDKPFYFSGKPFTKNNALDIYTYYRCRIQNYGLGPLNFFLMPWNITMHPESFSAGDSMGTIMLTFIPLVLFIRKRPAWLLHFLLFCAIACATIYFCIIPEARYFIAAYLAAAPIAAWVLEKLAPRRRIFAIAGLIVAANALFSVAVAGRMCAKHCTAAFSPEYRNTLCRRNTPYYEAFDYLNKEKPKRLFVFYDSQIWYYLNTPYTASEHSADSVAAIPGAYLLDIDYSQVLDRNAVPITGGFCVHEELRKAKIVFAVSDARVFRTE